MIQANSRSMNARPLNQGDETYRTRTDSRSGTLHAGEERFSPNQNPNTPREGSPRERPRT